jgi:hypothetical protein
MKRKFISIAKKIMPKSKIRDYFAEKIGGDTLKEYRVMEKWGRKTNIPMQSKEHVDFMLTKVEKCINDNLEGDMIECGAYDAGTSFEIAKKLIELKSDKTLYSLDTFEGHPYDDFNNMPEELQKEIYGDKKPMQYIGVLKVDFKQIKDFYTQNKIQNTQLMKGLFVDSFKKILDKKICFAYVDGASYLSSKQSYEFLKPRMVSNGIIIFGYNHPLSPGSDKAAREVFGEDQIKLLSPEETGQIGGAYWIKS